jgi:hypothetical protein
MNNGFAGGDGSHHQSPVGDRLIRRHRYFSAHSLRWFNNYRISHIFYL